MSLESLGHCSYCMLCLFGASTPVWVFFTRPTDTANKKFAEKVMENYEPGVCAPWLKRKVRQRMRRSLSSCWLCWHGGASRRDWVDDLSLEITS